MRDELYPIPEVARKLRLSRSTIYSLLKSGELDSVHIGTRRFVADSQLDEYVEKVKAASRVGQVS